MLSKISELTTKEMDRKEFLQNAGIGAMLLVGGGFLLRALGMSVGNTTKKPSAGYGSSVYGGNR